MRQQQRISAAEPRQQGLRINRDGDGRFLIASSIPVRDALRLVRSEEAYFFGPSGRIDSASA